MSTKVPALLPVAFALSAFFSHPRAGETFYVATHGKDSWSGKLPAPSADGSDGPLATLLGARGTVRRLKASGPLREPVRVVVRAGTYFVAEPLILEPEDSGTSSAPITYAGEPEGRAVISGGRSIGPWHREGKLWVAEVPGVKSGQNILRNNIFAFGTEGVLRRSREEEHTSFIFEKNIVLSRGSPFHIVGWTNGHYQIDSNLYWDYKASALKFLDMSFAEWQAKGRDQRSIVADPLCADPERFDFRLKPGSPAVSIGFEGIDTANVGLYGDSRWVDAPKRIHRVSSQEP